MLCLEKSGSKERDLQRGAKLLGVLGLWDSVPCVIFVEELVPGTWLLLDPAPHLYIVTFLDVKATCNCGNHLPNVQC